jgi:hypothetical protein
MALHCAAINAGMSFADIESLTANGDLFRDAYLTKDDGRRRHLRSALTKMRRDYDKAARYVGDRPTILAAAEALQHLADVRTAINTTRWTGRIGPRDKTVLTALVTSAESLGTIRPTISIRTLCEDTPYRAFKTVANAIDSLAKQGWITKDRDDGPDAPTRYTLHRPMGGANVHTTCSSPWGETAVHDCAPLSTRLATTVGVHGATVHAALGEVPASRNDVHRVSGVSKRTCSRWLGELARLGLARQTPAGWVRGDTDPETVAFEHGVDLVEFDRAQRHALQRQGWAEWRAARAPMRRDETVRHAVIPGGTQ